MAAARRPRIFRLESFAASAESDVRGPDDLLPFDSFAAAVSVEFIDRALQRFDAGLSQSPAHLSSFGIPEAVDQFLCQRVVRFVNDTIDRLQVGGAHRWK